MKRKWIFMTGVVMTMISVACSDNNTPVKGEPNPEEPDQEVIEPELFKANRLLIKHGLQLQCWVATDNFELGGKAGQPAYEMLPSDWALTGFTGPTFFGPPLINPSYFESFPNSQWAIAKAPHGDQLKAEPTDYELENGFLSEEQMKHIDKLTTICFGDEENYDYKNVKILKKWYDLSRKLYPDVMVHNNQFANQWSTANMKTYIKEAKPDILTYDWYYFHTDDKNDYIGAKDMAKDLQIYRKLALEGWKGDKSDYLAFGQYIQGFANQGTYKLTESQLRLYYYLTWTFGGKWVNWFRYLQGDGYGGKTTPTEWALLLEKGMPGQPTKYMDWANRCNQESKFIGDYLVRLKTTDVRFARGTEKYTEGAPEGVSILNPTASFLKSIKSRFITEPEEGADVYIGLFDIIPEEEQGDPTFFGHEEKEFFMLTNGYASKMEETSKPLSQKIEFGIDLTEIKCSQCHWINPQNGEKEVLKATRNEEGISYFEVELEGGSGALFILG